MRLALALLAPLLIAPSLPTRASAQPAAPPVFVELLPAMDGQPVRVAAGQVVRVARAEGYTVVDTAAWVQQRTVEGVDQVAQRLERAGQRFVVLTDLGGGRIFLAVDRIVLVREAHERHAAGARAAIVMVGLRFGTDVAVRESVEQVMAVLAR